MLSDLRGRIESQSARLRRLGVRGVLEIEQDVLLRLLKATLAATVAWEAVDLLGSPYPALGSLAAILVVQVTVRATLTRSIQLTIGVSLGLLLAVGVGRLLGSHWWTVALIVIGALVLGEILRLGPFSPQAAVSALLAFSLGSGYGLNRVFDTLVGAAIGIVVNTLIAPPSYVVETGRTLRRVAEDIGALLCDIGDGLGVDPSTVPVDRWLERARGISGDLTSAAASLDRAHESVSFNLLARTASGHLDRLVESRRALEHAGTQVRGIARALSDLRQVGRADADGGRPGRGRPGPSDAADGILRLLGPTLTEIGHGVAAFGRLLEQPASPGNRAQAVAAHQRATTGRAEAAAEIADLTTHGGLASGDALLLSSILVDVEHLIREVDVTDGAHAAAVAVPE